MISSILPKRLLHDKGLRDAIQTGKIHVSPVTDTQFQPATLDVRIGEVHVYDTEEQTKNSDHINKKLYTLQQQHMNHWDFINAYEALLDNQPHKKVYLNTPDIPIIIPPRAYAEIYLHEHLRWNPQEYDITHTLRSGRGRLRLKDTLQHQFTSDSERQMMGITNHNPNALLLYGQDRFAQLFFHPQQNVPFNGLVMTTHEQVAKHFPNFAEQGLITSEGYLVFLTGETALAYKKQEEPIDTRKSYQKDELFDSIALGEGYYYDATHAPIVELFPKVDLPENLGIRLLSRFPLAQPPYQKNPVMMHGLTGRHQVAAEWVDPGYAGTLTAHPDYFLGGKIQTGQPMAFGVVYEYLDNVQRTYGDKNIKSHYQHTSGASGAQS